jgi:uncharacterized repeat protein (TIGR02543 family)
VEWNTETGGGGTAFTATTPVSGNITVYAKWIHATYTVTFHQNRGDTAASPASVSITHPTSTVSLPTTNPTRSGYTFLGWNTLENGNGETFTAATPVSASIVVWAKWLSPDLIVKFGIKDDGYNPYTPAEVTAAFDALHAYLNSGSFTSTTNNDTGGSLGHLGDYIDLPSLSVTGVDGGGISGDNAVLTQGTLFRLIVVGINTFNRRATEPDGHVDTPHVVLQFQNLPGSRRMNGTNTNTTGYLGSEMRTYLMGNFLDGLKLAGVPEAVLWGPKRLIWKGYGQEGAHEITDTLWLPTERELIDDGLLESTPNGPALETPYSKETVETAANQAHLEYYDSYDKRIKYERDNIGAYWEASPYANSATDFCYISGDGTIHAAGASAPLLGVAPAFCVR